MRKWNGREVDTRRMHSVSEDEFLPYPSIASVGEILILAERLTKKFDYAKAYSINLRIKRKWRNRRMFPKPAPDPHEQSVRALNKASRQGARGR